MVLFWVSILVTIESLVHPLTISIVSLGKPPSAALEKLCAQTEALLDETAAKTGGSSAFINVRKDFLQA